MATFEDFLNERNITLKRRYTENHPAQTVGNSAKVRNSIIKALKDGIASDPWFGAFMEAITTGRITETTDEFTFKPREDIIRDLEIKNFLRIIIIENFKGQKTLIVN